MDADLTVNPDPAPEPGDAPGSGQLRLHVGDRSRRPDWRLDDETRAVGRRGIAQARAALRAARADHLGDRAAADAAGAPAASSRRPTAA